MPEPKVYVGSGKIGRFDIINIGLRFADLPQPNERGYINLSVGNRREVGKHGETHSVWINDWKPGDARGEERREQTRQNFQPDDPLPDDRKPYEGSKIDDLPF